VTFAECYGMYLADSFVNSVYEVYTGECPGSIGAAAYNNIVSEMYLYKTHPRGVDNRCHLQEHFYQGVRQRVQLPFIYTALSWQCAHISTFVLSSVTITCSLYDGQPVPCVAPNGDCEDKCPSNLPFRRLTLTVAESSREATPNYANC